MRSVCICVSLYLKSVASTLYCAIPYACVCVCVCLGIACHVKGEHHARTKKRVKSVSCVCHVTGRCTRVVEIGLAIKICRNVCVCVCLCIACFKLDLLSDTRV